MVIAVVDGAAVVVVVTQVNVDAGVQAEVTQLWPAPGQASAQAESTVCPSEQSEYICEHSSRAQIH